MCNMRMFPVMFLSELADRLLFSELLQHNNTTHDDEDVPEEEVLTSCTVTFRSSTSCVLVDRNCTDTEGQILTLRCSRES